jgi:TM2 domain-containing membrane protein YozV
MEDVKVVKSKKGRMLHGGYLASLVGWIVPGAGHFLLGHRVRGLVFFLLITFSLVFGLILRGKIYVVERDKPMTYAGVFANLGLGPVYFILRATELGRGKPDAPTFGYGKTFITTAGLMNILLLLDAFDISMGRKFYKDRSESEEEGETN